MKRRRRLRSDERQFSMPGIITAQRQAEGERMVGEEPKRASWVEENWPHHAHSSAKDLPAYKAPLLLLWADTFQITPGARRLLIVLCDKVEDGFDRASLPDLARASGCSVNATRSRLDALLRAGIVAVRPWKAAGKRVCTILGYEFRLLVDLDVEEAALRAGFRKTRKSGRSPEVCR